MPSYIALVHKDPDSDYGVSFPDVPGCISAGKTVEDARVMAVEALTLHIDGLLDDGASLPRPSTLEELMRDPDSRDALAFIVVEPQLMLPERVG